MIALAVTTLSIWLVQLVTRAPPGCTIFGCNVPVYFMLFQIYFIAFASVSGAFECSEIRSPCWFRFVLRRAKEGLRRRAAGKSLAGYMETLQAQCVERIAKSRPLRGPS